MSNVTKSILRTESYFSDDNTHRLMLKKTWNSKKPNALIVTKYGNQRGDIKTDLTTNLIINNVSDMGMYGGIYLMNLFTNMNCNNNLSEVEELNHTEADKYLQDAAKDSDVIILAWGSTNSMVYIERIKQIYQLFESQKEKLYMLVNPNSKEICHPLNPKSRNIWIIEKVISNKPNKKD